MQSTVGSGKRSDSNTAYLQPAISRLNLDILLNTQVTRLAQSSSSESGPTLTTVELGTQSDSMFSTDWSIWLMLTPLIS